MQPKKHRYFGLIISSLLSALIIVSAIWIFINRQYVIDQLTVWSYRPSVAVASIDERAELSDKGTFYFYASRPSVNSAADFNNNCPQQETGSAILGCYSIGRIYVYDVNNAELDGIEEVTAAHEMLHAAWSRLSDGEKARVAALLDQAVSNLHDSELIERMAYYDRTEPGERMNELHSIIATEFSDVSNELEKYYAQYFDNRSTIVALHHNYQSVFDAIKAKGTSLLAQINVLADSINTQVKTYNAAVATLNQDYADLQARRGNVDRTSASQVNAFNAELNALKRRQAALEADYARIQSDSKAYEQKVAEYNQLVVRSNELMESINSTAAPSVIN